MSLQCDHLNLLGHHIDQRGITSLPEKVQVIANYPQPRSLRKLGEFLKLVIFYRRFVSRCGQTAFPLTLLLQGGKSDKSLIPSTEERTRSFTTIKPDLRSRAFLAHPNLVNQEASRWMHPTWQRQQFIRTWFVTSGRVFAEQTWLSAPWSDLVLANARYRQFMVTGDQFMAFYKIILAEVWAQQDYLVRNLSRKMNSLELLCLFFFQ